MTNEERKNIMDVVKGAFRAYCCTLTKAPRYKTTAIRIQSEWQGVLMVLNCLNDEKLENMASIALATIAEVYKLNPNDFDPATSKWIKAGNAIFANAKKGA